MTSIAKKKKWSNTGLSRGDEKGAVFRFKHFAFFNKKDRVAANKPCKEYTKKGEEDENCM